VGQLDPRIVASAGGIPLVVDGKIIGAIDDAGQRAKLLDAEGYSRVVQRI
jgi:uncharacterized protein GlcG (DUF336 family)